MNERTQKVRMICIVCPMGCELEAVKKEGTTEIISIEGFRCPKGKEYANREIADPRRVLMTVINVKGGHLPIVSVKTAKPIPKQILVYAVRAVSKIKVDAPINAGDIIINNLLGTGIPVVATNNVGKTD